MSLKFGQIRPLVSMATDRVIMEKNGVATFSRLFFIRFFSYLQVMMTFMRAWRSSKFVKIAGNDDIHESLEEFEIRQDPTTDCGVSCP